MAKLFANLDELTNSATWKNVRCTDETELSFDQLLDVLSYINATADEDMDNDQLKTLMFEAIYEVPNQFK